LKKVKIVEAKSEEQVRAAKGLFLEYAASLDFDLSFQSFEEEMKGFPDQYSSPTGRLYLALEGNKAIGCVAVRRFEDGICEMKRLYVKPGFRGKKAGRLLAEAAIECAKGSRYKAMRLDTVSSMVSANNLYRTLGFKEIGPYRENPLQGAIYMELNLED